MKRKTNNYLMTAYIAFIFIAVFTKNLFPETKWKYIVTATTVASFFLVLSDAFTELADYSQERISTMKPKLETYLFSLRQNKKSNKHLDLKILNDNGDETGKTVGQMLKKMERKVLNVLRLLKLEELLKENAMDIAASCALIGFFLFFCVFLFDPIFVFLNNKVDEMTMLAFGIILATQFGINALKESVLDISQTLDDLNHGMEVLNQCCEMEAENDAD